MKLLKKVRVSGKTFSVKYFDFDKRVGSNGIDGNVDMSTQVIQIDSKNHTELQEEALLHEILHCVFDAAQLEQDEPTIGRLSNGLYQVLKDNNMLQDG